MEHRASHPLHPDRPAHPSRHRRPARPGPGREKLPVRLPHPAVRGRRALPQRPAGGAAGPQPPPELRLSGLCHAGQHPAAGRSAPEKAAGLQRRAPHHAPQPRLPRCLRRAGPFGLCGDARLAARRDDIWKAQALQNCREMVCQCRSHPSIFLWGVRVSGSADDESFYKRTNETVRRLDPPAPRLVPAAPPQPASGRCLRLCRLLLPRARRRVRGPHRRHPRHPERLSHQRIRGRPVPGQALRRRAPTAWRRPCATPPSSTTPSLSRAWRAASVGA